MGTPYFQLCNKRMEILNGGTADLICLRNRPEELIWLLWSRGGVSMTWQGENRHPKPPCELQTVTKQGEKMTARYILISCRGFEASVS